jgi:hypothetical protein
MLAGGASLLARATSARVFSRGAPWSVEARLLSEVRCCAFLRRCVCKQGVRADASARTVSVARRTAAQLASVFGA